MGELAADANQNCNITAWSKLGVYFLFYFNLYASFMRHARALSDLSLELEA